MSTTIVCNVCGGRGTCPTCAGSGKQHSNNCSLCNGSGDCWKCNGTGTA